jgi:hypothetical protein
VKLNCCIEKDVVMLNETVSMRFSADLEKCKIDVKRLKACLTRHLFLQTNNGRSKSTKASMIQMPVNGVSKGEKTKEDQVVMFDMNQAMDEGTPSNLTGELSEFAGRIQQNCNGKLITCSYFLSVTAEIGGCICCGDNPTAGIPVEILAPEKVYGFVQVMPAVEGPPEEGDEGKKGNQPHGPTTAQNQM